MLKWEAVGVAVVEAYAATLDDALDEVEAELEAPTSLVERLMAGDALHKEAACEIVRLRVLLLLDKDDAALDDERKHRQALAADQSRNKGLVE